MTLLRVNDGGHGDERRELPPAAEATRASETEARCVRPTIGQQRQVGNNCYSPLAGSVGNCAHGWSACHTGARGYCSTESITGLRSTAKFTSPHALPLMTELHGAAKLYSIRPVAAAERAQHARTRFDVIVDAVPAFLYHRSMPSLKTRPTELRCARFADHPKRRSVLLCSVFVQ